jgi:hypothetical protein
MWLAQPQLLAQLGPVDHPPLMQHLSADIEN